MSDSWESRFGLNRHIAADAEFDLDGDGFSNLEEFVAGTDPLSDANYPLSVIKIRLVK